MVLRLFLAGDLFDGAGGAQLAAAGALRTAEALLVAHLRLHEVFEVRGGPEHVVRAFGHTQLAAGAVPIEVFDASGAGRRERNLALRGLLGKHVGKAAVSLLGNLLRAGFDALEGCGAKGYRRSGHEGAAAVIGLLVILIYPLVILSRRRRIFLPRKLIFERIEFARPDAVEAVHAAGIVNLGRFFADGNAGGLAVMLASLAVLALVGVDHRAEHGKAREETEGGAYGADVVAVGAAAAEGEGYDHYQRHYGNHQRGSTPQPYLFFIESIAAGALGQPGQEVVAPEVDGLQKFLHHAAISAIGGQKGYYHLDAGQKAYDKQHPYAVAQPGKFLLVMVRLFLSPGAQVRNGILEHAQRANHRAVHAAKHEGQEH